jgi:hypothetical protein
MAFRALVAGLILALSFFSPAQAVVPELRQPAWAELTQEQKLILAPLSRDWDKMESFRKKKWLGIAKRYPSMKPEEQARVQRRMQDWANLTPEQRTQARAQYKTLKAAPPEKKQSIKEKWEQYKELPDEEKKRLAEKAERKRPVKPHALAPKPVVAPQPLPGAAAPAVVPPAPAATATTAPTDPPLPPAQAGNPVSAEAPAQPAEGTPATPSPPVAQ